MLIHGLGASHRVFDALYQAYGARHRIVAVDLPRAGKSGPWAKLQPSAIAERLADTLAQRRVERFRLFGHSFGGLVALALAGQWPLRITSLSVASTPAFGLPGEVKPLLESALASLPDRWLSNAPVPTALVRPYLRWIWGTRAPLSEAVVQDHLEAVRTPRFVVGLVEALRGIGEFRLERAFDAATFPRRVLWGEKDPLLGSIIGERVAQAIGAELRVLNEVGHCVPLEHPHAVYASLFSEAELRARSPTGFP